MRCLLIALVLLSACGDATDSGDSGAAHLAVPEEVDLTRWDPQWYRPAELSLTGPWSFTFDPDGDGEDRGLHLPAQAALFDALITVPFPWQSALSGVGPPVPAEYPSMSTEAMLQTYRGDGWYRREVTVPATWPAGDDVVLRFGAVDWAATVWVDGEHVATHVGGYTPFESVVDAAPGDTVIVVVRATDPCDDDPGVLLGKQGGIWYTCAGGIWQDVTLSHRPRTHLVSAIDTPTDTGLDVSVRVVGDEAQARLRMTVACVPDLCGEPCGPWTVEAEVTPTSTGADVHLSLPLHDVPVWSPDTPCVLGRALALEHPGGADRVLGYTARRGVTIDWVPGHGPADGVPVEDQYKDLLNAGRPVHLRAALDQGYHPEGLWQAPTRQARIADLEAMKDLGMNGVRMHIKPEPPWYYAAADVLGLWVVYDMPCPWDQAPSGPGAAWRGHWEDVVRALVSRDRSRPSILWWVNFNEAWGLIDPPFWDDAEGIAFVDAMYRMVKALDPTRPVEDHSPGGFSELQGVLPHVVTDVNSFHAYEPEPLAIVQRIADYASGVYPGSTAHFFGAEPQDGAPLIVSEFGGQWAGSTWGDAAWSLHAWLTAMRRDPKVRGWVFTQLTDVEWETNGLLTYDRLPKDLGLDELGLTLADLLGDAYLDLGLDPVRRVSPGEAVVVPVNAAVFGSLEAEGATLELRTRDGEVLATGEVDGARLADGITSLGEVTFEAPGDDGIYVIHGALETPGEVAARQGLYLVVDGGHAAQPGELSTESVEPDHDGSCIADRVCQCVGACTMTFSVTTPGPGTWRLSLEGEVAAYPGPPQQTDPVLTPGAVEVVVSGLPGGEHVAGPFTLADAPADHRGVLSLGDAWPDLRGAYGERVSWELGTHETGDVFTLSLRAQTGGVALFFRAGGRWLEPPTLRFDPVD